MCNKEASIEVSIGLRIKKQRYKLNLTSIALSKKSGVSPAYLSEVERGLASITVKKLLMIADALDIKITKLLPKNKKKECVCKSVPLMRAALESGNIPCSVCGHTPGE